MKKHLTTAALLIFCLSPLLADDAHKKNELSSGGTKKVTGEVVDLACYIDHNASGTKHADCAKTCIANGLPVGLKADDGKTYLLIGEHASLNKELAEYAAQKMTVEGKVVARDGINMI